MKRNRATAIALFAFLTAVGLPGLAEDRGKEQQRLGILEASERAFRVAVAAHRRGDYKLAESHYADAIREDERFVEAMVNFARALLAMGESTRALRWLDSAEREQPGYPHIGAVRGAVALQTGDTALAVDSLEMAYALMPRDIEVSVNLSAALIEGGMPDRAIRLLKPVVEREPHSTDGVLNIGLAYDLSGRHEEAAFFYRRFLELAALGDADREGVERRIDALDGLRDSRGVQLGDVLAATSGPVGQNKKEEPR